MTRAHVTGLVLVNWKGVFYERYRLDRHVTALEGANGAGKTTVMIAAYLVLLPDLSRVRFSNIGESGATGGDRGIWGRLGEPGRPSYAALDIQLPSGERLIAGVRLKRQSEPSVEASTFLIEKLPGELPLSELFLVRDEQQDQIAELDEFKAAIKRAGGAFDLFRSVKDYFSALFERGVTPLRLSAEEDRHKYNEMLRTSMTGGISRVLTSELRGFLLKEEGGLGDVLGRMRNNLDACRRTRNEVAETRAVERDISAVYEAGEAMFSNAYHAARTAAAEAARAIERAQAAQQQVERSARQLAAEVSELSRAEAALGPQLTAARVEHEAGLARLERLRSAGALALKLQSLNAELAALERDAQSTRADQAASAEQRTRLREQREQARETYARAALGLANLQEGLDELHRRAHAYRDLTRWLEEARSLLERPDLLPASIPDPLARLRAQAARWLAERARAERSRAAASQRRAERERAMTTLATLEAAFPDPARAAGASPSVEDALARARRVLGRFAEWEGELARLALLEFERAELSHLRERQRSAWERSRELGVEPGREAGAVLEQRTQAVRERSDEQERLTRAAHLHLEAASARLGRARQERARLQRLESGQKASAAARAQVSAVLGCELEQPGALAKARERLAEESFLLSSRRNQLQSDREAWQQLARDLAGPGAALDPELIRLREELDAELLLERFDAVSGEEAGLLEARLGPLTQALLVADPEAAARSLLDKPRGLDTLWLVRAGAELQPAVLAEGRDDIAVEQPFGARLTRRPAQPSLGAGARAARAADLRERAEQAAGALEQLSARARDLASLQPDFDRLASEIELAFAADPGQALAALATEIELASESERIAHAELDALRARSGGDRAELDRLERLLADRALLEAPDPTLTLERLSARIQTASQLQPQLSPLQSARRELSELLDILREADPDRQTAAKGASQEIAGEPEDLTGSSEEPARSAAGAVTGSRDEPAAEAAWSRRAAESGLDAALEWAFRAAAALEQVLALSHAAEWHDAVAALESHSELVPSLKLQHERALEVLTAADQAVLDADAAWERATSSAQQAAADRAGAAAQRDRVQNELNELGGAPDPSLASRAEQAVIEAAARRSELEGSGRTLVAALSRTRERAAQTARELAAVQAATRSAQAAAEPAQRDWQVVRQATEASQLSAEAADAELESRAFAAAAASGRALLIDRLARSRGGEELALRVQNPDLQRDVPAAEAAGAGEAFTSQSTRALEAWLWVREWLRRRVPLQLAEAEEPLRALGRLRDQLDVLAGRLARQEADLRGASADVARGIDVQVRRARGQVRRLNQHLEGVRFGSIGAIRVEMRRVERMEQILLALREGDAQELLFLPSLPIEEALDEIFRRYGGGRTGGQRLLDYREYVELVVEIKRQTAAEWEAASPTRLSTGEAIGVGAALMMVVLTEWERDAHLLRARPQPGSLRFLFLDEANRLSRDNLGVLFELCRNLDLQLMIAAPEVARAEGNTTYRLVRQVGEDGREEVIVSGRRAVASESDTDPDESAFEPQSSIVARSDAIAGCDGPPDSDLDVIARSNRQPDSDLDAIAPEDESLSS